VRGDPLGQTPLIVHCLRATGETTTISFGPDMRAGRDTKLNGRWARARSVPRRRETVDIRDHHESGGITPAVNSQITASVGEGGSAVTADLSENADAASAVWSSRRAAIRRAWIPVAAATRFIPHVDDPRGSLFARERSERGARRRRVVMPGSLRLHAMCLAAVSSTIHLRVDGEIEWAAIL
jgi:hypothetical protein